VIGALGITSDDYAVTSLPFTHIYGLSVVNSHLAAGARLVVQKRSIADPEFWSERARSPWTSLAGVTTTYELMRDRGSCADTLRGVRKLLHASDRMPPHLFSWLYSTFSPQGADIFLMYGQTEATGRISVLSPELLPACASSVGRAVSRGRISISSEREIVYCGPNVMMGYASCRDDLCRDDELKGTLHTGDLGYLDPQGMLCITGRKERTSKILDQRVSLDDIEDKLRDICPVAVVSHNHNIVIVFEGAEREVRSRVLQISRAFRLPPQAFILRSISALPRTSTGKICYRDIELALC
jgi:acyl-coenzyme A synthetase/AMP-(fatty) acid ligase